MIGRWKPMQSPRHLWMKRALLMVALVVSGALAPVIAPSVGASTGDRAPIVDHEFLSALERAGMAGEWYDISPHGQVVSSVASPDDGPTARRDEASRALRELAVAAERSRAGAEIVAKLGERLGATAEAAPAAASGVDVAAEPEQGSAEAMSAEADRLDLYFRMLSSLQERSETETEALYAAAIDALVRLADSRRRASSPIDGLPLVTLDAYVRGAESVPSGCSADWEMLAGVGEIESKHGTLGGAQVGANGRVDPVVLGPLLDGGETARLAQLAEQEAIEVAEAQAAAEARAEALAEMEADLELAQFVFPDKAEELQARHDAKVLELFGEPDTETAPDHGDQSPDAPEGESAGPDGESGGARAEGNGFAVVADTDGGRLDGNSSWDRAVGPMQFLPGTWRLFARDGTGDGWEDVNNLYDAAFGAGAYLCHLETRVGPEPERFILGYNDSGSYVAEVLDDRARFADYDLVATVARAVELAAAAAAAPTPT